MKYYLILKMLLLLFFGYCLAQNQDKNTLNNGSQIMSEHEKKIAFYSGKLKYFNPLLTLSPERNLDHNMVRVSGQGLKLFEPTRILKCTIKESPQIIFLKERNINWVKKVIRNEWLPDDLSNILLAVPGIVDEDAFIAAWSNSGMIFQLIITKMRIHLLVGSNTISNMTSQLKTKTYALENAQKYLNLNETIDTKDWIERGFGGLLLGYREFQFYKYWEHSLIFLTNGQNFKFSIIKAENEISPPQRKREVVSKTPWFVILKDHE